MEASPQPLIYSLAEILMKVFQVAYAQATKIPVPVVVSADDTIHIARGESQVDYKLPPSEPVCFAREADNAGRVR